MNILSLAIRSGSRWHDGLLYPNDDFVMCVSLMRKCW